MRDKERASERASERKRERERELKSGSESESESEIEGARERARERERERGRGRASERARERERERARGRESERESASARERVCAREREIERGSQRGSKSESESVRGSERGSESEREEEDFFWSRVTSAPETMVPLSPCKRNSSTSGIMKVSRSLPNVSAAKVVTFCFERLFSVICLRIVDSWLKLSNLSEIWGTDLEHGFVALNLEFNFASDLSLLCKILV